MTQELPEVVAVAVSSCEDDGAMHPPRSKPTGARGTHDEDRMEAPDDIRAFVPLDMTPERREVLERAEAEARERRAK